jgi:large subunit ribosomal protein L4
MSTVLTIEAAQKANINLVEGYKGEQALNDVLVAYRANRRQGNACTKNRSEVSGSGKKMWNQKGTGNARMGSKRSPIWVGGGVAFGPRPRDFSKTTTKNVRRLALRRAITARIKDSAIGVVAEMKSSNGKTKDFLASLSNELTAKNLLIIGSFDEMTFRAARNIQNVQLISPSEVNAEHLLKYAKVVITQASLETLAQRTA